MKLRLLRPALGAALLWTAPITSAAQAPILHTFGGPAAGSTADEGVDVALGADGATYLIGTFRGSVAFEVGTAPLTSAHRDVVVASYGADSGLRFAFQIGNAFAASEAAGGIALDEAAGRLVVTGAQPFGAIDYDPDPDSTALREGRLFVAGYDTDGRFQFAIALSGTSTTSAGSGTAVALGPEGTVFVTGWFSGPLDFDPDPAASDSLVSEGSIDAFVASYDAEGAHRFAIRLGGAAADEGLGVAADPDGNVYVAGAFGGTVAFDPDDADRDGDRAERAADGRSAFVASYTPAAALRFVHVIGGAGAVEVHDLAFAPEYGIFVTGQITGTAAFDPEDADGDGDLGVRTADDGGRSFLASYRPDGTLRFATVAEGGASAGASVAVDASGGAAVTGTFGGATFGTGACGDSLDIQSGVGMFVASYDAAGACLDAFGVSGTAFTHSNGIALGTDKTVVVTGRFVGTTDFDPGPDVLQRTALGQEDAFLVRYPGAFVVAAEAGPTDDGVPASEAGGIRIVEVAPNPFWTSTTVRLEVGRPQHVEVAAYDLLGRRVAVLLDEAVGAGTRRLSFDASGLPAGVYLVRASGDGEAATIRVVRLR